MAVKITVDKVTDIINAISKLAGKDVLVGIPDSDPDRKDGPISNAQIGYIQETGSPANNLPARPFLVPGVAEVQAKCADRLQKGATNALSGNLSSAEASLTAAGLIAESSVKRKSTATSSPSLQNRRSRPGAIEASREPIRLSTPDSCATPSRTSFGINSYAPP